MGNFASSFADSFKTGAAIGSNAALETMKEKMKQETAKAEDTKKVTSYLSLSADSLKDADPETQKRMAEIIGDQTKDWTPESAKSLYEQIQATKKDKTDFSQTMAQERFKSGMLGITEVIKSFAERGGTFADGTPITAASLQDFGKSASDRLLQDIGSMPQSNKTSTTEPIQSVESSIAPSGSVADSITKTSGSELLNKPIRSKASFKAEEKAASDIASITNMEQGQYRFMQQFDRSFDELKKFDPEFDKVGTGGWTSRQVASVAEKLDNLPETKALRIQVLPMANKMARDIESGKVTDNDRKIYADSFASGLANPSVTNKRLLSTSIINVLDKSGSENKAVISHLKMLSKSKSGIFKGVISQVLEEYPKLAKDIYGEDYEVVE